MRLNDLYWLPEAGADWLPRLKAVGGQSDPLESWAALSQLANSRLDFLRTNRLDAVAGRRFGEAPPSGIQTKPVRLAVLGSSTVGHLLPAIRVAGLRRNLWVATYEPDYGQYAQELNDPDSALFRFRPTAVLFALDAPHLVGGIDAAADDASARDELDATVARLVDNWRSARRNFGAQVLQQTVLNVRLPLMGSNEHRLAGSQHWAVDALNARLRQAAEAEGVDLVAVDAQAREDGIRAWHDPTYWHQAKQEVAIAMAPAYGELVGRLLAAAQGRSAKCLVLDLDNTLWGGVIGDDGLEGIRLGQGSAEGEAFVAFQSYARDLARRGVILAVCSKNDEANALSPFTDHPEMVLKRGEISCFVANWTDKATNLRRIAQDLNIGLDALVFADDNPFERNLVRQELPMVAVPELPEDATFYARCIADAGYFEALAITDDDRLRTAQYQQNREREAFKADTTDLGSYLRGLDMRLVWRRFDRIGLQRIVQLINKTNQFNLMTQRHGEAEVIAIMEDPNAFGLQLRLTDRFGDNGIIGIVIGRHDPATGDVEIDTWLMSCRVLGRQVEEATLNLVAAEARRLGGSRLVGTYRQTKKNAMVRDHYTKLGFTRETEDGERFNRNVLDLASFVPVDTFILMEGPPN